MANFRKMIAPDAAPYRAMRLEAIKAHPEAFYGHFEIESRRDISWFEAQITDPLNSLWGAFENETLAAIAGYYTSDNPKLSHKCKFFGVYSSPQFRGRGLAKRLLRKMLEAAAGQFEFAYISAEETNKAAVKLYHSLGFETYATEKYCMKIGDRYFHDELMVKKL